MAKASKGQKDTVGRVMHEFKRGELKTRGGKVKNPRQAIAIALSEAGESRRQSPKQNARRLKQTKAKERTGRTGLAKGKPATRAELYQQAARKGIAGRSRMSKQELQRALDQ
ncbi:MAG: hypothetical protein JO264_09380 [Acidisphaera sp.]|nr:hypothetical protein [Acidisphaera sp.]